MEVSYPKTTSSLGSAFGVQLDNRRNTLEKGGRSSADQGEHEKACAQCVMLLNLLGNVRLFKILGMFVLSQLS